MTKQEFQELYGKSVYQVRLEIASQLWCRGEAGDECLKSASIFVKGLLQEDAKYLSEEFHGRGA